MERLLRPDGHLLISEMYRDGQNEAQMTHVNLHHWWAEVDRIHGIIHQQTYQRQEIIDLLARLNLENLSFYDLTDLEQDPKDPAILAELETVFERYIQRAEGYPELQSRGVELRKRVQEIGFLSASTLLVLGAKKADG